MSKKIKVAVCDDERNALDIVSASLKKIFSSHAVDVQVDLFATAKMLFARIDTLEYDLLFLDINMPDIDGITLGKKIAEIGAGTDIVFVSSNLDRVLDTFEAQPFGFVRKSNFMQDLSGVVERYVEQKIAGKDGTLVEFKENSGIFTLDADEIEYIECFRNMQIMHLSGGREKKLRLTMDVLESKLSAYDFIRIHKGYLVNCACIKRIDRESLTLKSSVVLPVGRSRHKAVLDAYLKYARIHGISFIG